MGEIPDEYWGGHTGSPYQITVGPRCVAAPIFLGASPTSNRILLPWISTRGLDRMRWRVLIDDVRSEEPTIESQVVEKVIWSDRGLRSLSNFLITCSMAVAAPASATLIHSLWVLHRGYALYNADLGGAYFVDIWKSQGFSLNSMLLWAVGEAVAESVPTLLLLIAFRRKRILAWAVWLLCICAWAYFLFAKEIRLK